MTLGELISALRMLNPQLILLSPPSNPHSYRGRPIDLGFEPSYESRTILEVLALLEGCVGQIYPGYKGGEYTMTENSYVHLCHPGESGQSIEGVLLTSSHIVLFVEPL